MPSSLSNRTVLISGGSRGIGLAIGLAVGPAEAKSCCWPRPISPVTRG